MNSSQKVYEKVRAGQPYLYRKNGLPSEIYEIRLAEQVDHEDLNHALREAIKRYPYLKVRYAERRGDFYAVKNDLPLEAVESEESLPLGGRESNYHLIGVTHSGNRICVAFQHGLADGRGVKRFVETLIYEYCRRHYGSTMETPGVRTSGQAADPSEWAEPCGGKYSVDRHALNKVEGLARKGFALPETEGEKAAHRRYELRFSQDDFMALCHRYGASPVIMLSIMMSRAIHAIHPEAGAAINSNFPVDAREALGVGETYKNCVKSVSLPYGEKEQGMSTEDLSRHYRDMLEAQRSPEHCKDEFNKIIMLLDALKLLPSFESKRAIMRFLDDLKLDTYTISYIGRFNLGENERYVDSVHLYSNCSDGLVMNMTCASSRFAIDFVQDFEGERYLKGLLEQFQSEGIAVETSGKIEFCTPSDHLMRDMADLPNPFEDESRAPVWKRAAAWNVAAYRVIERGAVAGMTRVEDAFVERFLLRAGESVANARIRLAHENKVRIQRQAAQLQAR